MKKPKDNKINVGDGQSITFRVHPEFSQALKILSVLGDDELDNQSVVVKILERHDLFVAARSIEQMEAEEYEDFVVNNVDDETSC